LQKSIKISHFNHFWNEYLRKTPVGGVPRKLTEIDEFQCEGQNRAGRNLLPGCGLAFRLLDRLRDLIVNEFDLQGQANVLRILQVLGEQQIPLGG
jgi:hypothetical protein